MRVVLANVAFAWGIVYALYVFVFTMAAKRPRSDCEQNSSSTNKYRKLGLCDHKYGVYSVSKLSCNVF